MEEAFYTVEQVANLLQMHPKTITIQRYIREGKLSAVKFGKGWRVSGHDLSVFTESATFTEARIAAALENGDAPRATASAVVDVTVSGRRGSNSHHERFDSRAERKTARRRRIQPANAVHRAGAQGARDDLGRASGRKLSARRR